MTDTRSPAAFWPNKKVFLTGHTGFKGAWLALALHRRGAEIHGFALPPEAEGLYQATGVQDIMASSCYADLADRDALESAIASSSADILIHMAAQPLVRLSYADPVGTYMTNVMGTVHVLDALRRNANIRAAVVVTSDKCYENREWLWGYREDEPMGGFDPYSSSKGCCELAVDAFRRSYFSGDACQVASARAGNVIGGGDWAADRIVPDLIRSLQQGIPPVIRNPTATRPWQHVLEAIGGYLNLAESLYRSQNGTYAQGWNFGPDANAEKSVVTLVETVLRQWGTNLNWQSIPNPGLHEAHSLKLDSTKARTMLHWAPRWDFDHTVAATVAWYRHYLGHQNIRDFTVSQIDAYFVNP